MMDSKNYCMESSVQVKTQTLEMLVLDILL